VKPVNFPTSNKELTAPPGVSTEECGSLPVYNDGELSISCWEMTDEEFATLKKTKRVWLWVWAGFSQPPVAVDVADPFVDQEGSPS